MRICLRIEPIDNRPHAIRCFRLFTFAVSRERVDSCVLLRIIRRAHRIFSNSRYSTSK